jgi:hypothetical protein
MNIVMTVLGVLSLWIPIATALAVLFGKGIAEGQRD